MYYVGALRRGTAASLFLATTYTTVSEPLLRNASVGVRALEAHGSEGGA